MASTILSSGVRNNLLTLQQTTAEQGVIQNRLATGKRVNSAIDSPINYFTSLNLNDRASQFSGLLDGISNGIQTIQAASKGIDAIVKLVQSAQSTIKQAQGDIGSRPSVTSTSAIGGATTASSGGTSARLPPGRARASLRSARCRGHGKTMCASCRKRHPPIARRWRPCRPACRMRPS